MKALAVSGVTVWGTSVVFVQVTFPPFATVTVAELKEYCPLFSTIFTWAEFVDVDDEVAKVAAAVEVGFEIGAVVGLAGAVAAPPQAASIRTAIVPSTEINQADRRRHKF